MSTTSVRVDPEFSALIPPLSSQELIQLEANLLADGCRDPLVVWQGEGILLDGHNRYAICQEHDLPFKTVEVALADRDAAEGWIIDNQLGRRNLTRDQLTYFIGEQYNRRKKAHGGQLPREGMDQNDPSLSTAEAIAVERGVSPATVKRAGKFAEYLDKHPDEKEAVIKGHERHRVVKEAKAKATRETQRHEAAATVKQLDQRIIAGDFRQHRDLIADGSLSLIFTDPPYDRDGEKLFSDFGAFAAAKLAPGGSLVFYIGQTKLPAALDALRPHLRYWWTACCLHSGKHTLMREYGIAAGWKPLLWFVQGTRDDKQTIVFDVMSGGQEKAHHAWQQAESEAAYWIERLCPPDGLVCDPFLGSGTTAVAATKLGRQWIGFEIDEDQAKAASARIEEATNATVSE